MASGGESESHMCICDDRLWVQVQKRTFTNWVNHHLKGQGKSVEELEIDLEDGVALIKLLETLAPGKRMPGRYYANPKIAIHKTQNLAIAFRFITQVEHIALVNIGPGDIMDHNLKLVLGLIWTLILNYKIHSSPQAPVLVEKATQLAQQKQAPARAPQLGSPRKLLLVWVNSVLINMKITNFTTDWNDGVTLSALVNYCKPGLISDPSSLNKKKGLENIKKAMKLAEQHLNVPQLLDPADLALEKPDELSVMTYISNFCSEGSPGHKSLLVWVQKQIPSSSISNFTADWLDGRALGLLINVITNGGFTEGKKMAASNPTENAKRSMNAAEYQLGVSKTLTAEEFVNPTLSQLSRMAYLVQLQQAKAAKDRGAKLSMQVQPIAVEKIKVASVHTSDQLDDLVWVDLDCADAGCAELTAEAKGESAGKVSVEVEDRGPDLYRVKFKPLSLDLYSLVIRYGGEHVPGSPFAINLHPADAEKVEHIQTAAPTSPGDPVSLSFSTSHAGNGHLTGKANGSSAGEVPVRIDQKADGTYVISFKPPYPDLYKVDVNWGTFSADAIGTNIGPVPIEIFREPNDCHLCFRPPQPDLYKVNVTWGGKPVPGSPFTIDLQPPTEPDKVECGDPIYTCVGEVADLPIDITYAGEGQLVAKCTGDNTGEVPTEVTCIMKKFYHVSFLPTKEDRYTMTVHYGDKEVKRSPFIFDFRRSVSEEAEVLDMPILEQIPDFEQSPELDLEFEPPPPGSSPSKKPERGTEVRNFIGRRTLIRVAPQGRDKKKAKLTATATGAKTGATDVNIVRRSDGIFEVSIDPREPDRYTLRVFLNQHSVPQSPFIITYIPSKSTASHCKVVGSETFTHEVIDIHKPVSFDIDCSQGGEGPLKVTAEGPSGCKTPEISVTEREGRHHVYEVKFTAFDAGEYTLNILWGDSHVPNSPFKVVITDPKSTQVCPYGKPYGMDFSVDCKLADIKAEAVHRRSGTTYKVKVKQATKGKYKLTFVPKDVGFYLIHIYIRDNEISNSPIVVRYDAPPNAEAITVQRLPETACIGDMFSFLVDCKDGGTGELSIRTTAPKGKKGEKIEVITKDKRDGTFLVECTPVALGEHTFVIHWSGKPIPHSPFRFTVVEKEPQKPDPSKCIIEEHIHLPKTVASTKVISFRVSTKGAGPGEFQAFVEGPTDNPGKLEVTQVQEVAHTYQVSYKPEQPGTHLLHLNWGGKPLPNTPLKFVVEEPPQCEHGQPAGLDISSEVKLTDLKSYAIHDDSHTRYDAEIKRGQKGRYRITFDPKEVGMYDVHVLAKGKDIQGSPFRVKCSMPALPEKVQVVEKFQESCEINTPLYFTFDTHEAGSGEFECQLEAPKAPKEPSLKIEKRKDGIFRVEYIPVAPGKHHLHFLWGKKKIPGSPITITVPDPDEGVKEEAEEVVLTAPSDEEREQRKRSSSWGFHLPSLNWRWWGKDSKETRKEYNINLGRPFRLSVKNARDDDEITATAEGSKTGPSNDVHVARRWDGTTFVRFAPSQPDTYTLEVKMNGDHVPNSPFTINYFIASNKCSITDSVPETVEVDQKVEFRVDCTEAGVGSLTVAPEVPEGTPPEFVAEQVSRKPGLIRVKYTPHNPGTHVIRLLWEGQEIPDSPVTLKVYEPTMSISHLLGGLFKMGLDMTQEEQEEEVEVIEPPLESIPQGGVVEMGTNVKEGDDAVFTATCHGEYHGEKVDVKMIKTSSSSYKASFTPKTPDLYKLSIFRNDVEVKGSPYQVDLRHQKPIEPQQEEAVAIQSPLLESTPFLFPDFPGHDSGSESGEDTVDLELEKKEDKPDKKAEEFSCLIGTAIAVKVTAHSDAQRNGELCAKATGDRTGAADIDVRHKSDDIFLVNFNPHEPDRYTIEATLNGELLPRMPFVVVYTMPKVDATKCKVVGSKELEGGHDVGQKISFDIDVRSAGEGKLEVRAEGPSAEGDPSRVEVLPHPELPRTYTVCYTPTAPGIHYIHISWSGEPLPSSPIKITVIDETVIEEHQHGAPVDINLSSEGGMEFTAYALHEKDREQIKVHVSREGSKYRLKFQPTSPGLYYVHIFANDKEIPSSPVVVKYGRAPRPDACRLIGITNSAYIGEPVSFDIDVSEAGGGKLKIRLEVPGTEQGKITVNDNKDGTVTVQYIPVTAGKHKFHCLWADQDIPMSPFVVQIRDREDEKLIADVFLKDRTAAPHQIDLPDGSQGARIDTTTDMAVVMKVRTQTEEQRTAQLTSTAIGERVGTVYPQISKSSDDTYDILFTPPEPDCYTIDAKLGSEPVPSTPFVVNYSQPPSDEKKAKVVGLDRVPSLIQTQKEISFKVDMRLGGDGHLDVKAEAPEGCESGPVETTEEEPYVYIVKYVPGAAGKHLLHVLWDDKPIPGSPMNFDVQPVISFPHGKKAGLEIDLDVKVKQWDVEAYAIHTTSGSQHKVKVTRSKNGKFRLTFQPTESGNYALHVLSQKQEIPGSPFIVHHDVPTNPDAVKVSGMKKKVWVNEPTFFNIDASNAGSGLLRISVKAPKDSKKPQISVKEVGNKNYIVEYIPEATGLHTIKITWEGKPIPGSPFNMYGVRPSVKQSPQEIVTQDISPPLESLPPGAPEQKQPQKPEPKEYRVPIGRAIRVKVKPSTHIDKGKIVAHAHGVTTEDMDIPLTAEGDNFIALFNPTEPDRYFIEVKLDGEDVPGTPFIADYFLPPANPSKCVVGELTPDSSVHLNQRVRFQVDCTESGEGELDVDVEGPSVDEAEVHEDEPGKYIIYYTPTVPGVHLLHIKWAKQPIPSSPVTIKVSDARKVKICESPQSILTTGQPIGITFDTSASGCGVLTATCTGDSIGELPVVVTQTDEHRHKIEFTPIEQDVYRLSVYWSGKHVWGSPFKIDLKERKVDVTKIKRSEPQLPTHPDGDVSIAFQTGDAGQGDFSVVCINSRGKAVPVDVKETSAHTFHISFKPPKPDIYTMNVKYGGKNVEGSPFCINTLPSDPTRIGVTEPSTCELGKPTIYEFSTLYCGPGSLTATCHGQSCGQVPVDLEHEDGSSHYRVCFTPREPDLYTLHIKWSGTDIPNSPFIFNLLPCRPEKIVPRESVVPTTTGEDVEYHCDVREGGQGTLTASCTGKVCGDVKVRVVQTEGTNYKVKFTPPAHDLYHLSVFYNDQHVSGSPYTIDLRKEIMTPKEPQEPFDLSNLIEQFTPGGQEYKPEPEPSHPERPIQVEERPPDLESIPEPPIEQLWTEPVESVPEPPIEQLWTEPVEQILPIPILPEHPEPNKPEPKRPEPKQPEPKQPETHEHVTEQLQAKAPKKEPSPPAEPSPEEFTNMIGRALVVKVKAQTKEQKHGEVKATAIGDETGEAMIEVRKKSDEPFEVIFNPTEPDRYTIDIRLNDEPIPRSPFVVRYILPPIDATKCKFDQKDIPAHLEVGEEMCIRLSCKGAGDGKLEVKLEGPSAKGQPPKLDVTKSKDDPEHYEVRYTPTAPGYHFLHFHWSGTEIYGSPLKILVIDMEAAKSFHFGKPVGFDIDYEGRQSDLRAYALRDGSSTQINGKISKGTTKGKYKFTFNLKEPGIYYIHIMAKDKELPMSPMVVRILKPPRPDLIKVIDFPRKCFVRQWAKFTIDCKEAGGGDLNVKATEPGGKKGQLTQTDNKDGTYSIEYCPSVSGSHTFQMSWAGKNIPTMALPVLELGAEELDSEFYLVDCLGHRHPTSPSDGKLDATTDMNLLIQVKAKTTKQKKAELTVNVTGEKAGSCEAQVSKSSEDTFDILFSPAEPDCYTINAKLGSEVVPQTPVTVYYTVAPADATKCVIGGLEQIPASPQPNQEIVIKVDVRTAGNGTLSVITEGPSGVIEDPSVVKVKEMEPSIYYIYFTPPEPGSYKLKILWSGVAVAGSPFCFEVQDVVIHPHGKPIDLEVGIDAAKTGDIEAHAIHALSGTRYKVKVSKIVKGKYKLILVAKEPGVYAIHAFLKKKEIHGSPFYVRYDKPATPEACKVEGIPSQGYVFEPIKFTVNCKEAGTGHLRVSVLGTANGTVTVDKETGRVFEVTYTASCPGDDKIDITWEKKHVPHSPCDIHIQKRVPTCKTTLRGAVSLVEVGQKISLKVCNIGKGEGEPTAQVSGLECGRIDTHIDKIDESCYKVEFTPKCADDYTLDLKLNNQHLRCSPLFIKAVERGTFSTGFTHPGGVCHSDVEAQQQVNFVTHLEGVQSSGDVTAYCEYPGGSCDVDVSEEVDGDFGLCFNPPTPGTYKIHTKVKGSEHPSSPFQITCIEKEPECTIDESSLDVFSVPADIHHAPCFDIKVKESAQGKGALTVDAKGPGEAKTVISQKEVGTYTCTISTSTPGRYLIFIYWNAVLLKGCPFGMTFQQPSSIIGLDLENKTMKVGIPYHFLVNCEGMGDGALELTISPAGAADIRVSQDEDRKIYNCLIIPRQSGMGFEIAARYNGQVIAGSPYRVNFSPAAGPKMVLSVQTEHAETRDFSAQVESLESHKQIAATLTQLLQGQYSLEFDPSQGQEYMVTLKYIVKYVPEERSESDRIELEGSPYTLVYANGASCKIEGAGLGYAEIGQWNTFVLSTESAGPGQLQVEIEGEGVTQGNEVLVETQKLGKYQYEVKYKITKAGSYKLFILWGGRPLSGCPIAIDCGGSSSSSSSSAGSSIKFAISDLHQEIQIGSAINFSMQAEGLPKGGGDISVSAKSSTGQEITGRVSEKSGGGYSCSIDPPSEAGDYSIIIKWNGTPITSPITVRVIAVEQSVACKPQNVQITGTGLQDAFIGQECSFSIDTANAGEGTLNVRVEGPKGGFHINLDRDPDNQRVIVARYSPAHPGLYNVSIQWSGEHIPGSPFPVNIHGLEQQTS